MERQREFAVILDGQIVRRGFADRIKAGQWKYNNFEHNRKGEPNLDLKVVEMLQDGSFNERYIIQVLDYRRAKCIILENHYTTCGTYHKRLDEYKTDLQALRLAYPEPQYHISVWKDE